MEVSKQVYEIKEGLPVINWPGKLTEYLAGHEKQKDAAATVQALRRYLDPWVTWLVENGQRPTSQRIKQYLLSRSTITKKGTYKRIGDAIVTFTNQYVESENRVHLIPALGLAKEKKTLAMPPEMVHAMRAHVTERVDSLRPAPGKKLEAKAANKIAKYLGK